jgi:putative ABC transport system permease protein
MRFADYFRLSFRSLRRSKLRSGLTIAAILVGATGITVMLTFVTSVKSYVVDQFVESGQIRQIQVAQTTDLRYDASGQVDRGGPGGGGTALTPALEATLGSLPHVTGIAATFENPGGFIRYLSVGGKQLTAERITGYEPNGVIRPALAAGRNLTASDTAGVVLVSKDYATALGFTDAAKLVGQTVVLHTQDGFTGAGVQLPKVLPPQRRCEQGQRDCFGGPTSGLPAMDLPARVVGVVGSDDQRGAIILPLPWALDLANQYQPQGVRYEQQQPRPGPGSNQPTGPTNGPPPGPATVTGGWTRPPVEKFVADNGGYGSFLVEVDDSDQVAGVAAEIARHGVGAATGLAQLAEQKHAANIIGLVLGGLGLVALGIAALGIMNTMVMSVLERTREIGVMRAVGAPGGTIRRLFTFEAAMLGFFGGVIGVAIGYGFVLAAKPVIRNAVKSGDISGTSFAVPPWLIVLVIGGTTMIGLLSGLLPSRRAAKLDPVEALRYE